MAGDVKIVMTLDENGVQTQLVKMGQVVQNTTEQFGKLDKGTKRSESSFKNFASGVKDAVFAISIARFALSDINDIFLSMPRAIMQTAGEFQRMQKLMEGMSNQVDDTARKLEATASKEYVIRLSMASPFSITAIQDAFVKFKSGGVDPLNGSLQALTDSVAKFGGSEEAYKRAAVAIQQMQGKAVISMEELRQQLGEAVPNAMNMMAEGTGLSMQRLTKLVSDGAMESTASLDRMFTVMAIRNRGAAEEMQKTWVGQTQLLKTNFELFKNQIANAGSGTEGGSTFAGEAEKSLQELNKLFETSEMRKFAFDLGQGLASIVKTIREALPLVAQLGQAFTVAGTAFAGYLGAKAITSSVARVKELRAEAEKLAQDPSRSGKGGFLQSTMEQYRRLEIAQEQQIAREKQATAQKVALNQQMIAANERSANQASAVLRRQQAEEVLAAANTNRTIQATANARMKAANEMTQQAGRAYAQAIEFERRADQARASKKKSSEFVQQMNFYRQETQALQNKAVLERQAAQAEKDRANAVYQAIRRDKEYLGIANQQAIALRGVNDNLAASVTTLQQHAHATQRASTASLAFRGVISGFKTVFDAFGGWVGLVISGLAFATTKLMGFLNRWKEGEQIRRAIADGVATEDGVKRVKDLSAEADQQLAFQDQRLKSLDARLAMMRDARAKAQTEADQKRIDAQIKAFEGQVKKATAERNKIAEQAETYRGSLNRGEELLKNDKLTWQAKEYVNGLKANENLALKELRASRARLDDAVKKAGDDARKQNANITMSQLDAATKPARDALIENSRKQADTLFTYYDSVLKGLESRATKASGDEKDTIAARITAVKEQLDEARKLRDDTLRLGTYGAVQRDPKPNTAGLIAQQNREAKESPVLKFLEDKRVELAKAKLQFAQLDEEARDIEATAQNSALIDILGKLASGDFDRAASKKAPGIEPGKNADPLKDRTQWIKNFTDYLEAGKGGAAEFLAQLDGLDVKLRDSEGTIRSMFQAILDEAGKAAAAEQLTKALSSVGVKQQELTEDLTAAQRELNLSFDATPTKILELEKFFTRLSERLKLAGANLAAFDEEKRKAFSTAFEADYARSAAELNRKAEDVRIQSMTNVRSREAELNKRAVQDILNRYKAEVDAARKALGDTQAFKDAEARLVQNRDRALAIQSAQYAQTSKTQLQQLADSWSDSMTLMEQATVGWAERSAEVFANFLNGQEANFNDFVISVLKDMQMITIKGLMADGINMLNGGAPAQQGSLLGTLSAALTGGGTSGLPIDPAANAMRVVMAGSSGPTDPGGAVESAAKSTMDTTFGAVRDKFNTVVASMKTYVADAFGTFGRSAEAIFKALGNGLDSIIGNLMAMMGSVGGSSGGGFLGSLISMGFSYFTGGASTPAGAEMNPDHFDFAKGGIMTKFGPVPLRAYANGGIARSPQLALFGEGSMNEAYVPLPDGRSIPVTMTGAAGSGGNVVSISITVNQDGSTSEEGSGGDQEAWKNMAEKVRGVVIQELGREKRPGGMLFGT